MTVGEKCLEGGKRKKKKEVYAPIAQLVERRTVELKLKFLGT